jgi:hypothetical protein
MSSAATTTTEALSLWPPQEQTKQPWAKHVHVLPLAVQVLRRRRLPVKCDEHSVETPQERTQVEKQAQHCSWSQRWGLLATCSILWVCLSQGREQNGHQRGRRHYYVLCVCSIDTWDLLSSPQDGAAARQARPARAASAAAAAHRPRTHTCRLSRTWAWVWPRSPWVRMHPTTTRSAVTAVSENSLASVPDGFG